MLIAITVILTLFLIRGLTILVRNLRYGFIKEAHEEEMQRSEHIWHNHDYLRKPNESAIDGRGNVKNHRNYFS